MTLLVDIALQQGAFHLAAAFDVPAGITALFGPSGSGKSSLLAAVAGLKQGAGRVVFDGCNLQDLPAHRRGVGLVFQDARLFPHLSVRGNLDYARRRAARPRDPQELAHFFEIAALLDRPIGNLSGGEKSRVAMVRALIAAPKLLLLDEPFAALDGPRRSAYGAMLRNAQRRFGFSVLMVTHDITDAGALADHIVGLRDGRVVAAGPLAAVVRTPPFQTLLDPRDIGVAVPAGHLVSGRAAGQAALWLRADQVLVAAARPNAISARNILEGRVAAVLPETGDSFLVEMETEAGPILSRLTGEAVQSLALAPGGAVWAVFKAHGL